MMMRPYFCFFMCGHAARVQRNEPRRCTRWIRSQSTSLVRAIVRSRRMPALLMSWRGVSAIGIHGMEVRADHVDAAVRVNRGLDHFLAILDAIIVCHGFAPSLHNLCYHRIGSSRRLVAVAAHIAAKVIHCGQEDDEEEQVRSTLLESSSLTDDCGTTSGKGQRICTS